MRQMLPLPLLLLAAAPAAFAAPAACPEAGARLSESLAGAKQRIDRDGEVRVEFEVDADGSARLLALDGSRLYRAPVRNAVLALDCQPGTPQRYVLNIRFVDPAPPSAAASAMAAQTRPTPPTQPR
ncbi:hypothetical protein [Roseateles sp.]|uniref:hypothetical protein n=1 Tax=Roseateles sp. TaxID=1971397 RepID=UPI0025EE2E2B|nr:hypothetical protein [Roseateles sp.]MBV8034365.1 hypothetical protein [Roseateles sp.]